MAIRRRGQQGRARQDHDAGPGCNHLIKTSTVHFDNKGPLNTIG
jgi:hypothetical protein